MKALIVLVALLALVYSQNVKAPWDPWTAWSAEFICTAPQFGSGIFRGKVVYDYSIGAMSLVFIDPKTGNVIYDEFFQWNVDKGYRTDVSTGQFAYQYLYKRSPACPCETTGLNYAMPALFPSAADNGGMQSISGLTYWISPSPGDKELKTGEATKYIANDGFNVKINGNPTSYNLASFFWTRNGEPAGFNINDVQRRTFALEKVTAGTPGDMGLVAPKEGCKCGKQIDVVVSMDRSGSISRSQWGLELQFMKNLAEAFTYGPLTTNLGVGNWNAKQWETLAITSGISYDVVTSAVNSMGCCPGASSTSCCCCGTPIGGGIWLGCNMLSKSTRGKAQKVLILLTDGCQNHLWDPKTTVATSCGCKDEKACAQNATCVGDITKWALWCDENVPGTRIIVVGVGGADTICKDQLLLAAGGDPLNVYNPTDWTQLLSLVETITATACTADSQPCPGCCGICTCGQCIPTTECPDPHKCATGVPDDFGCCSSIPKPCDKIPCKFEYCVNTQGCLYDDILCPDEETCTKYTCENDVCLGSKKTYDNGTDLEECTEVIVYKCINDKQCDDKSECTADRCENHDCVNEQLPCPKSDKCVSWTCLRDKGCVNSTLVCNDRNLCTEDLCDPDSGCKFVDIPYNQPDDYCFYRECDPNSGVVTLPRDCSKEGYKAENCTVPACNASCYDQFICAAPPPTSEETFPETVVLVSTLTTAAVAGIVIAAVLLAAGMGGGAAMAIAQAAGAGGAVVTASNPLYAGAGIGGDNPLNQVDG